MTRFERYKRDITVEEITKVKFRNCKGCARENIRKCTGDAQKWMVAKLNAA